MASIPNSFKPEIPQILDQKALIIRVLSHGSGPERELLSEAEQDPDLDPQVKRLIEHCRLTQESLDLPALA